jgi:DnaJ-domain-containing protein 1
MPKLSSKKSKGNNSSSTLPNKNVNKNESKTSGEVKPMVVSHVTINEKMVNETARFVLEDDINATQKAFNPKGAAASKEETLIFHTGGLKKRKSQQKKNKMKKGDEDPGLLHKICCSCCYFGDKYLNLGFGTVILILTLLMILFVGYLKFGENLFFFQSVHNLEEIDYYDILKVDRSALPKQIRKAHREQTRKWHPDRNPDCGDECVSKMSLITEAYTVLMNQETRDWHNLNGLRVPDKMMKKVKSKLT